MKRPLKEIAATMRAELLLSPFGHARYSLSGGLVLVLWRNEPRWRLTLRRVNVYPSEREVEICSRAFGVPTGTEPQYRQWNELVAPGQRVRWQCVDLIWREVEVVTEQGSSGARVADGAATV